MIIRWLSTLHPDDFRVNAARQVTGQLATNLRFYAGTGDRASPRPFCVSSRVFAFNNEFDGYTFFQYRGKEYGTAFSASDYTESYIRGDQDEVEVTATMHHELRAHMVLGDFGRNVPQAKHSDAYARGQGPPTSEADKVGEEAEKEAKQNAAKKP